MGEEEIHEVAVEVEDEVKVEVEVVWVEVWD
jgi:hypothetical protein